MPWMVRSTAVLWANTRVVCPWLGVERLATSGVDGVAIRGLAAEKATKIYSEYPLLTRGGRHLEFTPPGKGTLPLVSRETVFCFLWAENK